MKNYPSLALAHIFIIVRRKFIGLNQSNWAEIVLSPTFSF